MDVATTGAHSEKECRRHAAGYKLTMEFRLSLHRVNLTVTPTNVEPNIIQFAHIKTPARPLALILPVLCLLSPTVALAGDGDGWHASSIGGALGLTALFGFAGVLLAVAGYKIFDLCTPGDLHKEIVEHKNVAAAIIGASVILGVCIIIAAAIMG